MRLIGVASHAPARSNRGQFVVALFNGPRQGRYLVVTAESLVDADLPTRGECGLKHGVLRALKDAIFNELPCLRERERLVVRLLNEVYDIRSRHFHAGRFASGELEPWRDVEILQMASQSLTVLFQRMDAVVNAMLVAWLLRRSGQGLWPRAIEPMPEWRDHQFFSVSVEL